MIAIPSKTDILGFNLNADQQLKLSELHRLCEQRMAVKLPALNSARCKAYETIHGLDERITKYAPMLELTRTDSRRERNVATDKLEDVLYQTVVSPSEHARVVWQYWFIKNPITM